MRMVKEIYQILAYLYIPEALACVGLIFLAHTLIYFLRWNRARTKEEYESIDAKYLESVSCLGQFVLGSVGLVVALTIGIGLPMVLLIIIGHWLEKNGILHVLYRSY